MAFASIAVAPRPVHAQSTGETIVAEPFRIPSDDAELTKLHGAVSAEVETIQAEVKTRSEVPITEGERGDAEKAVLAAVQSLLNALEVHENMLEELTVLRPQVRDLEDDHSLALLGEEITGIQAATREVDEEIWAWRPGPPTDEEIREAEQYWETKKGELAARVRQQEDRDERKSESAPKRAEAAKEAETAQTQFLDFAATYESKLAAAPNDLRQQSLKHELRLAQVEAANATLREERIDLVTRRDARLSGQAEQRIPALRELIARLEKRVEMLKKRQTSSEVEMLRLRAEQAKSDPARYSSYERAYIELRVAMYAAVEELTEQLDKAGVKGRFTEESFEALKREVQTEHDFGAQLVENLERRAGERIPIYYRRIEKTIASKRGKRDEIRALDDQTFDDRARIVYRLDQLEDEIAMLGREVESAQRDEKNPETLARLSRKLGEHRTGFDADIESVRGSLDGLLQRLREASQLLSNHVETLAGYHSELYWAYLRVREPPLWKYSPAKSAEEWAGETELRRKTREPIIEGLEQLPASAAILNASAILFSLAVATVGRRRLYRYADKFEGRVAERLQASDKVLAPISDRLHLQLLRFAARTVRVVVPGTVVWVCVLLSPLDGRLARAVAVALMIAGTLSALVSTLFSRSKPRFRLVPCSNVVAAHYRRWLRVLLFLAVVCVPLPGFLDMFGWLSYSRGNLWSAYRVLTLVAVLVFGLNRQSVLRVAHRSDQDRTGLIYVLVHSLYPVLYLLIVALLILEILGYRALTTYVVAGAAKSAGALILARLCVRYARDVTKRYVGYLLALRSKEPAATDSSNTERAAAWHEGREVTLIDARDRVESDVWFKVVSAALRWSVAICTAVLVLGFWGVSSVTIKQVFRMDIIPAAEGRPAVSVGGALLSVTIFALSWVISRGIRSFLETRIFPAYSEMDRGGRAAISTLLHYVLVVFGAYIALAILQIPLGAITVVLGTVGLGLGLGLQPVFVNFLSGLIILFERHVKVGDLVEVDGVLGEVTSINLRATSVKTFDNVDMVIPNSDFVSHKVTNWTLIDTRIRGKVHVSVDYKTDPRLVEKLLLQAASENSFVLIDPPPRVRFTDLGDNGLEFSLVVWFRNVTDRWDFMSACRYRIFELFKDHAIEVPFPQRTFSTPSGEALRVRVETSPSVPPHPARHKESVTLLSEPRP